MVNVDPDAALLQRLAGGDPAAARLLVAAKLPRVLALAARLLRDPVEAEDVAQEAFLRVWRHSGRWTADGARFDTWLHTIVLNLCRDRMRRRKTQAGDAVPELPDPSASAEAVLIEGERERQISAAIGDLPERQREAIILVHYQNCSGQAAAQIMGVSVEALESLLARGRRALRTRFLSREPAAHDGSLHD